MFCVRRSLLLPLMLAPLVLGACRSIEPRPTPPAPAPDAAFSIPHETRATTTTPWWEQDLPVEHAGLVARLLQDNPAILVARTEVMQQQALLQAAESGLGLQVDASAGASATRTDGDNSSRADAGLDASLPIDLSGKRQSARDAREWEWRAAGHRLQQTRSTQVEALLLALLDYAEAHQRGLLLQQQIETTRKQLHLTEVRFTRGLVSSVDVLQQREQIASLEQQVPDVQLAMRIASNRAGELLGRTPQADPDLPQQLPTIPAGVALQGPRDLLQRDPGLRAQQAALRAADADFETALRARLPDASLTGSALWQAVSGNPGAIVQAALDASLNLFDSGARQAEIERRRALLEQAGLAYLQDWLRSVRNTDDLLNTLRAQGEQLQRNHERRQINDKLYQATLSRYQRGVSDYLPVLTALRDLQAQERETLRLQADRQRTLVRLKTAAGLPPEVLDRSAETSH